MITDADRFRRARTELEQAMALGCTIVDLRRRNRALAHRAQAEVAKRTADLMTNPAPVQADAQDAPGFWWMKD
ncbi:hypothetical protein N6H05_01790 [Sphingobium sp. WTD-1]|uniref:hypothetical protein n=1 Tax=Sphingobium sp. WTD-1 TaxID=2979467 RepID=UPI0024DEF023|nr:hypothetical protein [Sphingobium sp. WTD-1]WIA56582.1 hypothetical protein N6H05_01790 [Sphingobium sp. WTD-1]